jgi:hypothetical protein
MAHPYLEQLQGLVSEAGIGDVDLDCKHFFSGAALYAGGKICATYTPVGLAFKLPRARCKELIAVKLAVPLCYFKGAPAKSGYALFQEPDDLSGESLSSYFSECIEHTLPGSS